jgi:glucuronoarabinoxylan endo-1,4-beta-xylanase
MCCKIQKDLNHNNNIQTFIRDIVRYYLICKLKLNRAMLKNLLFILIYFFIFPFAISAQNLLTNGNFENNFTQWNNLNSDGSVATYSLETTDIEEGAKAMKVEITTLGTNPWSVQTIHSAWPSVSGKEYKLHLYAKAQVAGTTIRAIQQLNTYAASEFVLTTDWLPYEWIFTAQENNLQFLFHFFQAGTILIDNITIEPTIPIVISNKDTLRINTNTRFQTMEGFGAAQAYYERWVTQHPNKEELYQLVFQDLGLDWLRLQNVYGNGTGFDPADAAELVQKAHQYADDSVRILMTSWSPPANIKSNNDVNNGGTLLKDANNNYMYADFGKYWKDALTAYANAGVHPNWISIQNEPDWQATYASCLFAPTETATLAGYDKALDSVYQKIKDLPSAPLLIGAEPTGIGSGNFKNYSDPIKSKDHLFGYAYHLYNGGDPNTPNSYNSALSVIGQYDATKPNIMTEYEHADAGWLNTGWLINNVLTKANASAYFYWDLMWDNHGLIDIDYPWDPSLWQNAKGYTINPPYYAFKHFSKHIKPGYERISGVNANNSIISSAFIKKQGGDTMVFVLVNGSTTDITSLLDIPGKSVKKSDIYQSSGTNYYDSLGALNQDMLLFLPANSITTVVMNVIECTTAPTVDASLLNSTICDNQMATVNGTISGAGIGQWKSSGTGTFTPDNTTLNATYTPSLADKTAGSVVLTLSSNGTGLCNVSDQITLYISNCTGLNKTQKADGVKVFPVPAINNLNIDLSGRNDVTEFSIINSSGMKVSDYKMPGKDINIDLHTFPSGLYIILFKTSGGETFKKEFVKNE